MKAYLAKHPSALKQNCTQEKTPFSGTVLHTLSHGVLRFVVSVENLNPAYNKSHEEVLFCPPTPLKLEGPDR